MAYKPKIRTKKNKKSMIKQFGGVLETNAPPTITDNLKKFAEIWLQAFNNIGMYTLDKIENKMTDVSMKMGINPNNSIQGEIAKLGQKAERLNDVLDTPQGKKVLANLNSLFDRITKNVLVPNSQKLTKELIENLQPILIRGQNAVFALLSASPFGAVIDIPRFVSESLGVVEKSVSLANDVLDVGSNTVEQVKTEKGNFDNIVSELGSLTETANAQVSSGLDIVKSNVDDFGKSMMVPDIKSGLTSGISDMKTGLNSGLTNVNSGISNLNSGINNMNSGINNMRTGLNSGISNMNSGISGIADVNKTFDKYKKETNMIGGRVKKAYSEFLSSNVTSPQIMQQYGGTKKRNVRNRLLTRKHR